ncbi:transcriptional regulator [Candidatus Woesearchaeota archaeon]|nr:transcriptional regulator [Candidatus Woesearchaeota archaeon]RLE43437.1 MAG: transcriptional regulator [Candidatus Woesearchaeota archaeon]
MTRRQEIIELLKQGEWSIQQIANHFKTTVAEILPDFKHITRTIHPRKIATRPATCRSCGFVFKDRKKYSTPSKCPRCKSEWINPQTYWIE